MLDLAVEPTEHSLQIRYEVFFKIPGNFNRLITLLHCEQMRVCHTVLLGNFHVLIFMSSFFFLNRILSLNPRMDSVSGSGHNVLVLSNAEVCCRICIRVMISNGGIQKADHN